MKNNYSIAERNRIVEENLPMIDKVIRRNWSLMLAAHLDYDDVYQDLAVRLIRCVENYDPDKGSLHAHIYSQLRYELLNCKTPLKRTGITGLPYNSRWNDVLSMDTARLWRYSERQHSRLVRHPQQSGAVENTPEGIYI